MNFSTLQAVYRKKGLPLWVTPCEISTQLRALHYAECVRNELSDWLARRLSMSFIAGHRAKKQPAVTEVEVERQLMKMGYCMDHALEIADFLVDAVSRVYAKGVSLRHIPLAKL